MHGLFLLKIKNELQVLTIFSKFYMNQNANQRKYGLTKAANFIMRSMKSWLEENLLLLKDSLEP